MFEVIIKMVECEQCKIAEELRDNEKLPDNWIEIKTEHKTIEQFCSWDCIIEAATYRVEYAKLSASEKLVKGLKQFSKHLTKMSENLRSSRNL